jgi:hypothetical protein
MQSRYPIQMTVSGRAILQHFIEREQLQVCLAAAAVVHLCALQHERWEFLVHEKRYVPDYDSQYTSVALVLTPSLREGIRKLTAYRRKVVRAVGHMLQCLANPIQLNELAPDGLKPYIYDDCYNAPLRIVPKFERNPVVGQFKLPPMVRRKIKHIAGAWDMSEGETMAILLRSHPCLHGLSHPMQMERSQRALAALDRAPLAPAEPGDDEPIVVLEEGVDVPEQRP